MLYGYDDYGPPLAVNRTESKQASELLKQIEVMRNEHSTFRQKIDEQMNELVKKIDDLKLVATTNSDRLYKVHLWDDTTLPNGFREKMLYSVEGFTANSRTTLVDTPDDADLIVWATVRGNTEKEVPPSNYSNVVLLDYADGCRPLHQKRGELKHLIGYFKRSFVQRDKDSVFESNCTGTGEEDVLPFAYSGLEALVNKDMKKERGVLITNVLRTGLGHNTVRTRVVGWTSDFVRQHGLTNQSVIGLVGSGSSSSQFDESYLKHLADTKIIVTCNPWKWEGDFRLWEALLSGAMVMVDRMDIPKWMPHPFIHKKHLVYYDTRNQTEFNELLEFFTEHEEEARKIGEAGRQFVLDHHMAKDRVSYILDKIENKIVLER